MDLSAPDNLVQMQWTILAEMIRKPSIIGNVVAQLSREDFTAIATRTLWDAITSIHNSGAPMEIPPLQEALGEDAEMLLNEAWHYGTDDVQWYVDRLKVYRRAAEIKSVCYELTAAEDMEEIQEKLDRLNAMAVTSRKVQVYTAADMAGIMLEELNDAEASKLIPTGLRELDDIIQLEAGDFVVLGGYPSAGKTALALQIARSMAYQYHVGFYSLETNQTKAARRILAATAGIPLGDIKRKQFSDAQCTAAAHAATDFAQLHFDFVPASSLTVQEIKSLALSRHQQVIFVDYLQIVRGKGRDRYEIVTNISQDLHRLAQDYQIIVIALAQLTRPESIKGKMQRPTMASFRESGQIEQDADVAMLLYLSDPDNYKSDRELKVAKNKEGAKTKINLAFDGTVQRFEFAREHYIPARTRPRHANGQADPQMRLQDYPIDNTPDTEFPF